jgi:Flp pilus assembly protein TadG
MLERQSRRRHLRANDSRGQALVEFSMVFLIFMTIFTGMIEFGIAFAVQTQITFASRDAAGVAAESGGSPTSADGAILNGIDRDLTPLVSKSKIDHVDIFWATATGGVNFGAIETYTPSGPLYVGTWDGWTRSVDLYPGTSRCAFIPVTLGATGGCQLNHSGPDKIGVRIVYRYTWTTPLPNLAGLFGTGFTFIQTSFTTMEPVPSI